MSNEEYFTPKMKGDGITKINESITLLQEYRTALISAATGKIDVRGEIA